MSILLLSLPLHFTETAKEVFFVLFQAVIRLLKTHWQNRKQNSLPEIVSLNKKSLRLWIE